MKLIFIRHGDPDYEKDSLTEKGWREAEILSERVAKWDIKQIYCSPMGRAQDTCSVSLKKTGREAITYDWLQEFYYRIWDEKEGRFLPRIKRSDNPEKIVIGSIYTRNEEMMRPIMWEMIQKEALPLAAKVCEVVPAALGEAIGDYAALSIAYNL